MILGCHGAARADAAYCSDARDIVKRRCAEQEPT